MLVGSSREIVGGLSVVKALLYAEINVREANESYEYAFI